VKWKKRVGAIVFVLVGIILALAFFLPRNTEIPALAMGCYRSENAPDIAVRSDSLNVDQGDIGETSASYQKDNIGHALLTAKPLLLKPVAGGRYKFFLDDRAARYVRFSPGPPAALEIIAADGMTVVYRRVDCGADLGAKVR